MSINSLYAGNAAVNPQTQPIQTQVQQTQSQQQQTEQQIQTEQAQIEEEDRSEEHNMSRYIWSTQLLILLKCQDSSKLLIFQFLFQFICIL